LCERKTKTNPGNLILFNPNHPKKCTFHHLEKFRVTLSSLHLGGEELEAAEVGASCELDTLLASLRKITHESEDRN
jgi:hypothetical protein